MQPAAARPACLASGEAGPPSLTATADAVFLRVTVFGRDCRVARLPACCWSWATASQETAMPWSKHPDPLPPRGDTKEKVLIVAIAVLTILQAIATYFLIREVLKG